MSSQNQEEEILAEAMALPPAERGSYLDRECLNQPALRQRIEARLTREPAGSDDPNDPTQVREGPRPVFPNDEGPGARIDNYTLLEKIGEGGFGVVYVAEQKEPVRRRVALKIIKLGMDTRQVVARFEAERQALALMDHPNIAMVFDAGATETGRPYFIMELVLGVPITEFCDQHKLPTRQRLELFLTVCRAIQHAHQKGIIHRDIKPSNVLVASHEGVPTPKVIDFGIAKAVTGRLTEATLHTGLQQFVGTPAYMSPEQAELGAADIDTRSDIYSLGVLLYELLTGRTPFESQDLLKEGLDATRRAVREIEPPRPSTRLGALDRETLAVTARRHATEAGSLVQQIRGDLDWIVMRCLEKERARRYETANGLAVDVTRHLNNEPVAARPPSTAYRIGKAFRRNKLAFSAAAVVVVALLTAVSVSTGAAIKARKAQREAENARAGEMKQVAEALKAQKIAEVERARAEEQRKIADQKEAEAQHDRYLAYIRLAQRALDEGDLGEARELLARFRPSPGKPDPRGWEWRFLWQLSQGDEIATLGNHDSRVFGITLSTEGNIAASCDAGGGIRVWDLGARKEVGAMRQAGRLNAISFQPSGNLLATAGEEHFVCLWSLTALAEESRLPHADWIRSLAFFPDGRRLATLCADGGVHIWDVPNRREIANWPIPRPERYSYDDLAVSPDGEHIAVSSRGVLQLLHATTGNSLQIAADQGSITTLRFSPDGKLLISAGWDKRLRVYEVGTGSEITNIVAHHSWICSAAFTSNGSRLVTAGGDQALSIWDTRDWSRVAVLKGHLDELGAVAASPDGKSIVSGGKEGAVKLWPLAPRPKQPVALKMPVAPYRNWSADDKFLLTYDFNNEVSVLESTAFRRVARFRLSGPSPRDLTLSADGELLAVGARGGILQLWRTTSGKKFAEVSAPGQDPLAFSAGNSRLLTRAPSSSLCKIWSVTNLDLLASVDAPQDKDSRTVISPDGNWLAAGRESGLVTVWRLSGAPERTIFAAHRGYVYNLAFSKDSGMLATAGEDGFVRLWRPGSTNCVARLRAGLLASRAVAFPPDNHHLFTGDDDGHVRLWDLSSFMEILSLPTEGSWITDIMWIDDDSLQIYGINGDSRWHAPPFSVTDLR